MTEVRDFVAALAMARKGNTSLKRTQSYQIIKEVKEEIKTQLISGVKITQSSLSTVSPLSPPPLKRID
jgi:hypothetical protein